MLHQMTSGMPYFVLGVTSYSKEKTDEVEDDSQRANKIVNCHNDEKVSHDEKNSAYLT